jgi:uncharacterized membrane protein
MAHAYSVNDFAGKSYASRRFFAVVMLLLALGMSGVGIAAAVMSQKPGTLQSDEQGNISYQNEMLVWLYPIISASAWGLVGVLLAVLIWRSPKK